MRLGVMLPLTDIGGEPGVMREFAQAAEEIGYTNLGLPDHVLGVNIASRPDWGDRNTSADLFHDPFVAFAFLAGVCRATTEFSTQVLILAQRQAVLVAKQAASLDVLCGGRFRLGVGVGWNPVEFTGLNENFSNRGRRSAEQVQVMQALWAEPHVTFKGRWHTIEDAGINPLPVSGKIPVWFGGHVDQTLERIATLGDGWIMNAYPPGDAALGGIRQAAPADRTGGTRSGRGRHRGVDLGRCRQRSGLARGGAVLAAGRGDAPDADQHLRAPPPQAHPWPLGRRASGRDAALP